MLTAIGSVITGLGLISLALYEMKIKTNFRKPVGYAMIGAGVLFIVFAIINLL